MCGIAGMAQPMANEDEAVQLVVDGEIDDHVELLTLQAWWSELFAGSNRFAGPIGEARR